MAFMWLGRVFLMNPIGLAVTAIAAAAYLLYRNWEPVVGFFTGIWTQIRTAFAGGLGGVAALIVNWSPLGFFYQAFAGVLSWFGVDLPAKFSDFGVMILRGLVSGITSAMGSVKDAVVGAGSSVIAWFKEKLDIHSPSRVFAELGDYTMQGLAVGMGRTENEPLAAVSSMARKLTNLGAGIAIGAASTGHAANRAAWRVRFAIEIAFVLAVMQGDVGWVRHLVQQPAAGAGENRDKHTLRNVGSPLARKTQILLFTTHAEVARMYMILNDCRQCWLRWFRLRCVFGINNPFFDQGNRFFVAVTWKLANLLYAKFGKDDSVNIKRMVARKRGQIFYQLRYARTLKIRDRRRGRRRFFPHVQCNDVVQPWCFRHVAHNCLTDVPRKFYFFRHCQFRYRCDRAPDRRSLITDDAYFVVFLYAPSATKKPCAAPFTDSGTASTIGEFSLVRTLSFSPGPVSTHRLLSK